MCLGDTDGGVSHSATHKKGAGWIHTKITLGQSLSTRAQDQQGSPHPALQVPLCPRGIGVQ